MKKNNNNLGQFLTLLCAGQKIILPKSESLNSGTIKIFNAYKQKGIKFDNCSGKDRNEIFNSFGKTFNFNGMTLELSRQKNEKGGIYRTIKFDKMPKMV